jgi:N-dimethylarginine dimethylaminohydrolase
MSDTTRVYNSTGKLKRILLGKPEYIEILPISDVARDLYDSGVKRDRSIALRQHEELADVFRQCEIDISWINVTPGLPWQFGTRDFGTNTPFGFLVGRFRYKERQGEEVLNKQELLRLGETVLPHDITRGCLEGGDCYWIDENTLIIGNGNRSTYSGYENAKEILSKYGVRVFVVEFLSKWNHLDVIFQPIADKFALVCIDAVPDYLIGFLEGLGWELIKLPGEYAMRTEINMLTLGDDRVLSFKGNRLNEVLKAHGFTVFDPEFDFFTSFGGGPHCETQELERER